MNELLSQDIDDYRGFVSDSWDTYIQELSKTAPEIEKQLRGLGATWKSVSDVSGLLAQFCESVQPDDPGQIWQFVLGSEELTNSLIETQRVVFVSILSLIHI